MAACLLLRGGVLKVNGLKSLLRGPNLPFIKPLIDESTKCLSLVPVRSQKSQAYKAHDHRNLWTAEKVASFVLVPLLPLAIAAPSPILDYSVAFLVGMHTHWGLEAIVIDYIRPSIFGDTIPKVSLGLLYLISAATVGGLCYFNYTDVGIGQAIRMFWKL
uniref:Succinate dehydrogenase [ubiquinone] cytochrome b small subunit n=1 Tax=Strigamia maritima TaxID=126957 RepID=T1JMF3_STRMM